MLRKAAALFLVCGGIATWMACGSTTSHYVYATIPQANEVLAYREDPNSGVLTALPGSPFVTGNSDQAVVVHPSKKFLYVSNSGAVDNDISLFTIASNGALTEVTPRTVTGGTVPNLMTMDAAGAFLYVSNAGSNSISVFSIDASSGALSSVGGSPFPIGLSAISMKLSPSGNFLYVGGGAGTDGLIEVFSSTSGVLSAIQGASTGGTSPYGMVIDSTGSFLYAANTASNSISEFSISSDGTLTALADSPIGGGTLASPVALLIDPSGKFLYVANNATSGTLSAYTIDSAGGLTILSTSPFTTGANPDFLVTDPSGKYLLVGTRGTSGQIQVFKLSQTDGTLSLPATYSTGNTTTSIAVLP